MTPTVTYIDFDGGESNRARITGNVTFIDGGNIVRVTTDDRAVFIPTDRVVNVEAENAGDVL